MKKLPEVQEAKELMNAAMDWSAFKWLFEKSRVRETADRANAALDRLERAVKSHWSEDEKAAYKAITAKTIVAARGQEHAEQQPETIDPLIGLLEKIHEAHDAARRARADAEATFDEAERQMSTSLAQEGCKKAIRSWRLYEKAIREAEEVTEQRQVEEKAAQR